MSHPGEELIHEYRLTKFSSILRGYPEDSCHHDNSATLATSTPQEVNAGVLKHTRTHFPSRKGPFEI